MIERYDSKLTFICKLQVSTYAIPTSIRVRNLIVNREYEFRVMAENQYGTSDPCTTVEPIKAKYPFGESSYLILDER